ncbi:cell division cycle-associated protein 2 isoform X2 [Sphaeramia orbicularis]|uniref:cell division cycle-associated protein 2 isoform X2 n=1 Tax=Sphaeramia orbicularis TaxID=375764 RepID=UPI00117FC11E|nr:cell division cycle-associated protein 2 isoform X2 [Sphaeramia orbicularis]
MASLEINTPDTQEDQKDSCTVLADTSFAPLNFSGLTPSQFGISVQSFTPASLPSSKRKDKSRLAQLKARRRSSVGVRGSPETNSLIRFIAQQKMKTPTSHRTPELVKSSPFLPRVASTLKQKMASFQSLMGLEESEVCEAMPRQDSNTGGCIKTRDYLSDRTNLDAGKENHPRLMTPTPGKRRRVGPIQGCEMEIREASAPTLHFSLREQEEEEQPVRQGPVQSSETVEEAQAELISPPFFADCEPPVSSEVKAYSPTENQQEGVFELQSLSRPTPDDPAAASPAQPAPPFQILSLPSLLEMKPTGEVDSTVGPTVKRKKKQVRFGRPLSPELFDKTLPPSTPLQKGSTPARAPTPGGSLKLRSLLKTPERNEPQTPTQQDPSSPTMFGASPTLIVLRSRRMSSTGEDDEETDGKIVFPSKEEINIAVTDDAGFTWDAQPLNLNDAFDEEFLSQIPTESDSQPNTVSLMDTLQTPEPVCLKGKETQPQADGEAPAPGRCSNRRKKAAPEHGSTTESPAPSSSRKRKPEESEPVKRSTRSAAKSASGKMKMTSTATRRWNREVDRSLYGSREYASKNPALSPITERRSFISQSPVVLESFCTAQPQEPQLHVFSIGQSGNGDLATEVATGDINAPNTFTAPEVSICFQDSGTGKRRRMSGRRGGGKAIKGRKVISEGNLQDQMEEKVDECCEGQATISQEDSKETLLTQTILENLGDATEELCAANSAQSLCTDTDGKAECPTRSDSPTSVCRPAGEEFKDTLSLSAQRKVKRGRRSQRSQPEEDKMNHKVEERGQGEQAASQQENNRSGSDSHEEERAAHLCLAPWQADFNFEDVFKPVAARGQRSVRRSLRNQSNLDHGSNGTGLAWLPHISPDSSKEARRRTRGRRLSGALPAKPSVPEEDTAGTETA